MVANYFGQKPVNIAQRKGHHQCIEILQVSNGCVGRLGGVVTSSGDHRFVL